MESIKNFNPRVNQFAQAEIGSEQIHDGHVLCSAGIKSGKSGGSLDRMELPHLKNARKVGPSLIGSVGQETAEKIKEVTSDPKTQTANTSLMMSGMASFSSGVTGGPGNFDDPITDQDPSSD
ncbi:hypothetical protein A2153_01000 [Candidatus Gottesmanbacteria bacterium RBG_16_38_7b]|uniref:Uncharacterized protein n=1 Tax=Candidatus Gottesmanbacteria bacterium RBG_16_38_7b TaxID=1798372 RepID=A0A1F5YJA4_9BACT|nr:MAG: hypothetical protein A2153_01000 [Candidatus Gottesmanbacteria bacterium RBG_16_38_7b]